MSPKSKTFLVRDAEDRRSLCWSLALFPLMPGVAVLWPTVAPWLFPFALYLGFSAGVLSHYHNHRGVFHSRVLNQLYAMWLSVFYGFPLFAWVPTHNRNHHKYVNGPGDATRTDRDGRSDTAWNALTYPTRSGKWQLPQLKVYLSGLKARRSPLWRWAVAQAAVIPVVHLAVAACCVLQNGWFWGLGAYGLLVLLPALFASWSMMFINYVQHVGCDATSPDNHSRNFVGTWENWLVFDAGLHTVHHEHPGVHWSQYRALHQARQAQIHPALCQRNVFTFLWNHYVREAKARSLTYQPTQSS